MNQDELIALRKKILNDVMPLVVEGVENTPDRFTLLLRIIQSGDASADVFQKAYESAASIEEKDEKLSALMSLLDEIDFSLVVPEEEPQPQAQEEQTQYSDEQS